MPFGVSWGEYLKMFAVASSGAVAGSQLVHLYYKPLDNMEEMIEVELNELRAKSNLQHETLEEKIERYDQMDRKYRAFEKPLRKN